MRQVGGYKFRRQYPVGVYIADFACVEAGLIVELDGGQHVELAQQDEARTRSLNEAGFKVLRFWNDQVFKDMDAVLQCISDALPAVPPTLTLA